MLVISYLYLIVIIIEFFSFFFVACCLFLGVVFRNGETPQRGTPGVVGILQSWERPFLCERYKEERGWKEKEPGRKVQTPTPPVQL